MTPEEQQKKARGFVETLLERRLENGGIRTTRPEVYFQCAETPSREYPRSRVLGAGSEVRIKTWRQWSEARVTFDDATGEVVSWQIPRFADPATDAELTQDDAIAAVAAWAVLPQGAQVSRFYHYEYSPGRRAARIEWEHVHQGLRVDGDIIWAVIHPETRRLVEFGRHWREPQV